MSSRRIVADRARAAAASRRRLGRRDGQYTLEGIDWNTGASAVHYRWGGSFRFFSSNNLVVMPNGAVDLFNRMGLTRMQPRS